MAQDKQSITLILTVINTFLLLLIGYYTTCPVAKKGSWFGAKESGKICPITKKGSATQPDVPAVPAE